MLWTIENPSTGLASLAHHGSGGQHRRIMQSMVAHYSRVATGAAQAALRPFPDRALY